MVENQPDLTLRFAQVALLRRFDRATLSAVLNCTEEEVDDIISGIAVEAIGNGFFRLRPAVLAEASKKLRTGNPAEEISIHQRAFHYYLASLKQSEGSRRNLADEDECLYHLDALYTLVGAQEQWNTVLAYIQTLRDAQVVQKRHEQRLDMYEGYCAVYQLNFEHGEALLTQVLQQANLDSDVQIKALKGLADGANKQARYVEALTRYDQLFKAAEQVSDHVYQGLALLNMSLVYHELDQNDRALERCEQSLRLFKNAGERQREGYALHHAALYSLYLGRWDAARRYNTAAEAQFQQLGLWNYLGFVYWVQGFLADVFGDVAAAETAYLKALKIAEQREQVHMILAADTLLYLGLLYQSQSQYTRALEHYDRALAYASRLDRQHQVCLIHFRRGQVFERIGRPGKAFLIYRAALGFVEHLGSSTTREDIKISLLGTTQQIYEAMVLLCLSCVGRARGEYWIAQALNYVEQARSRAFLDALSRKTSDQQRVEVEVAAPATLNEIQASLPDDALLVEYFTTGVLPRGEHLVARIPPDNRRLRDLLVLAP
jgi:tetratricopeptide (TPR) repeat protein